MSLIGVISDTHGMLNTIAVNALAGVDRIIHAGDVGSFEVLEALEKIAPVHAVRGNMDRGELGASLAPTEILRIDNVDILVLHDIDKLDLDPVAAGISCVIFGHSHQPFQEVREGVLYLNPGSAGPRRFRLPICLALLTVNGSGKEPILEPRFVNLDK